MLSARLNLGLRFMLMLSARLNLGLRFTLMLSLRLGLGLGFGLGLGVGISLGLDLCLGLALGFGFVYLDIAALFIIQNGTFVFCYTRYIIFRLWPGFGFCVEF